MANSDKDILITPNSGSSTADPKIEYVGADSSANDTITVETQFDGSKSTLSFEGSAGQLFSVSNELSGTLFAVNDSSGIPSIEVDSDGEVRLAEFSGNVGIGISTPTELLHVDGRIKSNSLTLSSLSTQSSEATAVMIDGSGIIGTRELGSNAFNSTSYLTGNQTITLTGDVSGSGTTSISVTIADDSHNHVISNVDGLQSALDTKIQQGSNATAISNFSNTNPGGGVRILRVTGGTDRFDAGHHNLIQLPNSGSSGYAVQIAALSESPKIGWRGQGSSTWSNWYEIYHEGHKPTYTELGTMPYSNLTGTPTIPSLSGYATESYVGTQISNLVDGAPGALNTLNELAAALDDDADFHTAVTTSLGTKLPLAGGTVTGGITLSQDASDILHFTANSTNDNRGIAFNNRSAVTADYNDNWLRLNSENAFTNGIYTPGSFRADGHIYVTGNLYHQGDGDTYLKFDNNRIRLFAGGTAKFDSNNTYLTGNQTITLTGDVSGSGTTSINVTVADNSHVHDTWNLNAHTSGQNIDTAYSNKFWTQDRSTQTNLGTYPGQYTFVTNLGGSKSQGIQLASSFGTGADIWFRTGTDNAGSENGANVWKDWRKLYHVNYHPEADKWTTARTISLAGDATGSISLNGSVDKTLTVAIVDDSHNHIISNVDGLQTALDGKLPKAGGTMTGSLRAQADLNYFGLASGNNEGEIVVNTGQAGSPQIGFTEHGDASWAIGIDDAENSFKIHGTAGSTIPTINNLAIPLFEITTTAGTAYLNNSRIFHEAYHPNADSWTTARTITLGGDLTGNVSINGTANVTLTAAVVNDSHEHHRLDSTDDRDMKPNTSGIHNVQAIKPFFSSYGGMTGSANTTYVDVLAIDTYSDASGGGPSAITFKKGNSAGNPEMHIWHAGWNATTWSTGQRVFADNYHPNADVLTTARTIAGTSFNGSANIDINYNNLTNKPTIPSISGLAPIADPTFTGDLNMPNKLRHVGDTHTYIQFHANDQFRVVTGGTQRFEVNTSGIETVGRLTNTYSGTSAHTLQNATSNGTVLTLTSTGDNRVLSLQTDHVYSNGTMVFGDNSHATYYRGSTHYFQGGNLEITGKIYHAGDTDNYIHFSAADTQSYVTGNSTRLQITNSLVRFNQEGNNQDFQVFGSTDDNLIFADASANKVGIGTNSPASILHVKGTQSYGSIRVSPTSTNGESAMAFFLDTAGTTTGTAWVVGHAGWGNTGDFVIGNQAFGGPVILAQQNGNVGIGTTAPLAKLQVGLSTSNSGSTIAMFGSATNGILSALSLVNTTGNSAIGYGTALDFHMNSAYSPTARIASIRETSAVVKAGLGFFTYEGGLTEKMRITNEGNVGIGEITPVHKVEAVGTDAALIAHYSGQSRGGIAALSSQRVAFLSTSTNDDLVFGKASNPVASSGFTEYMRIDNGTGRVGIGTTAPQQKLQVDGNIYLGPNDSTNFVHSGGNLSLTADTNVYIISDSNDTSGVSDAGDIVFGGGSNTNTDSNKDFTAAEFGTGPRNEWMRIESSTGNVGIGTTAPQNPLEIKTTNKLGTSFTGGTDGEGIRITQSNYTVGNHVSLIEASYDDSSSTPDVRIGVMFDGTGSHLKFGTSNNYGNGITNTAMIIDPTGQVGIGADPTQKLHVNGTILVNNEIQFTNDQMRIYRSTDSMKFRTGSSDRLTISSTGDATLAGHLTFGDGHDIINARHVRLDPGAGNALKFWDSTSYQITMASQGVSTYGRVAGETTSDYNMYFRMSGGTNRGFVFQDGTANNVAGIDASGNARFKADVVAYTSSDKRLKDNITRISNPIEKINKLSGNTFEWNDNQDTYEKGMKDVGVIAQEVEEVLPEIVETRDNGYKAVKYEKMVALLIEGMKEQQEQINELTKQVQELKEE